MKRYSVIVEIRVSADDATHAIEQALELISDGQFTPSVKELRSVFDMGRNEFITELSNRTTTELLFENAHRIYDYLAILFGENCSDSVLREWAFQWYANDKSEEYNKIYDKWMDE